jgi:NADP-dependent 3-hydroxy acid dehydrogenase YdfG
MKHSIALVTGATSGLGYAVTVPGKERVITAQASSLIRLHGPVIIN